MAIPTVAALSAILGEDLAPAAGFAAPAEEISAVHISELLDPTTYLLGGELLLTTGLALPDNRMGSEKYVRRLKQAGVTALAVGLGPVHAEPPATLIHACRRHNLTLLVVPPPTPFLTITKAYWSAVSRSTEQHLNDALAAHRGLVDAAASRDPVPAVLRTLTRALEGWAAVLDVSGDVDYVHPTGMVHEAEKTRGEIERLKAVGVHSSASFSAAGRTVVVFPLAIEDRVVGYLAAGMSNQLDAAQRRLVLTACALLSIDTVRRQQAESAQDVAGRCVASLVDLGFVDAARRLGAEAAGLNLGNQCRILVAKGADSNGIIAVVRQWCPDALAVRIDHGRVWFLLPAIPPVLTSLDDALAQVEPSAVALISSLVRTNDVGTARLRLEAEMQKVRPGHRNLRDDVMAASTSVVRERLGVLLDKEENALVESLVAYLRAHGRWEFASRAMAVHRNTLRMRISRCQSILGLDLGDPDVAAQLWLMLRAHGYC
ncbi:PucR family transcriptional regulator ligand-binding domain-containing protein [Streptomyces sp. NPDC008343]|uniref:helix-turn-helix domain-containing protein n=1 Tax=Streptomyces sp. NPDC008343 TaxID=3364828 RepID=UPI0036E05C33